MTAAARKLDVLPYDPRDHGARCDECPLKDRPLVPPIGHPDAGMAVVGEAPGYHEEIASEPFVGPSGKLLNDLLKHNDLERRHIWITNALLHRAPELKSGSESVPDAKTIKVAMECCKPRLEEELAALKGLKVIVPLGATAVRALTGRKNLSILAARGFVWEPPTKTVKVKLGNRTTKQEVAITKAHVVPSVHPAFVLRAPAWEPVIATDMDRAVRASKGQLAIPQPEFHLAPEVDRLKDLLARLDDVVAVDVETTKLGPTTTQLICIGVSDGKLAIVVPWVSTGKLGRSFYGKRQGVVMKLLKRELLGRTCVTHNGPGFDHIVLARVGIDLAKAVGWEDTLVAHHAFASHFPQKLDHVVSMYCDSKPWKILARKPAKTDERGAWNPEKLKDEELWTYNGWDITLSARLWKSKDFQSDLHPERSVYQGDKRLALLCRSMTEVGVPVDLERRVEVGNELRGRQNYYLGRIRKLAGFRVVPTKLDHLRKALFRVLHAPILFRLIQSGIPSTGKETLHALAQMNTGAGRFAKYVLKWRESWKLRSTYVDGIDPERDGRVHPNWRSWGTPTGRFSCVAKGTPIEVLRDASRHPKGVPIEDVRPGDVAYAFDAKGKLCLRRVTWAGKTGTKKIIRIHWVGAGHHHVGHLDLTPEHRVRLASGKYVRADHLEPGDRVMALSRGVTSYGYARLWATGHCEITREHRFVYQQINGKLAEHVHHRNGNKLDNRIVNLDGTTASAHTSYHGRDPSPELRHKRSINAKARYDKGLSGLKPLHGFRNPRWLCLKRKLVLHTLRRYRWSITNTCRALGHDFSSFKSHLVRLGFDLSDLRFKNRQARRAAIVEGAARARRARLERLYNHEVVRVEELSEPTDVYDLTIEEAHNFVAGEICIHNCRDPNLQNLKRGSIIRSMYATKKGNLVIAFDFSQLELRVAAYWSGDEVMIAACESGDVHAANAVIIFGELPPKYLSMEDEREGKVNPDWKRLRDMAKTFAYAVLYFADESTTHAWLAAQGFNVSLDAVRAAYSRIHRRFKRYYEAQEQTLRLVQKQGYLRLPLSGRIRWFGHEPLAPEVGNYSIQGSAADIINRALPEIDDNLPPDAFTIMQGHDAAYFECKASMAERVKKLAVRIAEQPVELGGRKVVFPVDAKIGRRLSEVS